MIITLGTTDFVLWLRCTVAGVAVTPTGSPTYKIIDAVAGTTLLSGSFGSSDELSETGLRKTSSLSITSGNGFAIGGRYRVERAYVSSATTYAAPEYEFLVS